MNCFYIFTYEKVNYNKGILLCLTKYLCLNYGGNYFQWQDLQTRNQQMGKYHDISLYI